MFYIMDENRPEVNYTSENFSESVHFLLPYRYTRPFVIANWTTNLYNPSETELVTAQVTILSSLMEDEWYISIGPIVSLHIFPSMILLALWGYVGYSLYRAKSRKPAAGVQVSEQPQDVGNTLGNRVKSRRRWLARMEDPEIGRSNRPPATISPVMRLSRWWLW
jgi:hypothetical protein